MELLAEYLDRKDKYERYARQVYLNMASLIGRQRFEYNSTKDTYFERQEPNWKEDFVFNLILPRVRILHYFITKSKPELKVSPATIDMEDIQAAQVATKVLKNWWKMRKLNQKIMALYRWVLPAGTAYFKSFWDKDIQYEMKVDGKIKNIDGDMDVKVISPLSVFPSMLATDSYLPNLIYARLENVDIARSVYNKNNIEPTKEMYVANYEEQIDRLLENPKKEEVKETSSNVLILEFWEFPNASHKKGRFIVQAGKDIISDDETLPDGGWTKYDLIPIAGKVHSKGIVEDLIEPNKQYNKTQSKIAIWRNLTIQGKLMTPSSANIGENVWTSQPMEKITYTAYPGVPAPWVYNPPPLPQWIMSYVQQLISVMDDISLIHEASRGMFPKRISSGKGIELLQEQDVGALTEALFCMSDGFSELGHQVLKGIQENYDDIRTIEIVGKNLTVEEEFSFKGTDLKHNHNVVCELESGLPTTKIARQEMVTNWFKEGLIPQTDDGRKLALKLMEIPELMETELKDENFAITENGMLLDGKAIEIHEYDNHVVHFKIITELKKRLDFVDVSIDIRKNIDLHWNAHKEKINELMNTLSNIKGQPEGGQPPASSGSPAGSESSVPVPQAVIPGGQNG